MSWVQWQGVTLPTTKDDAQLRVWLHAPDEGGHRSSWHFDLFHHLPRARRDPKVPESDGYVSVDIAELGFRGRHWHEIAGLSLRSTPAWSEQVEEFTPYGRLTQPLLNLTVMRMSDSAADPPRAASHEHWVAHDFTLSLGHRDGWSFPCEIDAWAIPKETYQRDTPETAEELARFGQGPPNLRILTRAIFTGGNINLERCGDDPLPLALRRIREQTGCEEVAKANLEWMLRRVIGQKDYQRMPGWRSTVTFATGGKQVW